MGKKISIELDGLRASEAFLSGMLLTVCIAVIVLLLVLLISEPMAFLVIIGAGLSIIAPGVILYLFVPRKYWFPICDTSEDKKEPSEE